VDQRTIHQASAWTQSEALLANQAQQVVLRDLQRWPRWSALLS
jgi:hypothetical protein